MKSMFKPSLQYHGGHVFGKAENNADALANTLLSIMVKCMNGGIKFLIKMIPVSKLTSTFLHEQVCAILDILINYLSFGKVIAIIADNNRTNQAFLKLFQTVESKPWKTTGGLFLLFRNNWITEKVKELEFDIATKWKICCFLEWLDKTLPTGTWWINKAIIERSIRFS